MFKNIVLFFLGFFDYFHKKKLLNLLKKEKLNNLNLVLDVGAHKGESISFFLKNFNLKKIISFEASPYNFNILKKNLTKLQNLNKNTEIKVENLALGNSNNLIKLKQFNESSSSTFSKINKDSVYYKRKMKLLNFFDLKKNFFEVEVNLSTLNTYVKNNNIQFVYILKIDTEGYEFEILKGLEEKIKLINLIIFEHHYDDMIQKNYTFGDINKILINNNFNQIFKIKMPFRKSFEYVYSNLNEI